MKTTYKLLGVFWDKKEDICYFNFVCSSIQNIRDYKEPFDLFDNNKYVRKILFSELFNISENFKKERILEVVGYCSKIFIENDCRIASNNKILKQFIFKRYCQIVCELQKSLGRKIFCSI